MKSLKDMLTESLVTEGVRRDDAEKAIYDLLRDKCKSNRVKIDDDELRDLANAVINWYDEDGVEERDNHPNVKSFIRYVEMDLPGMADNHDKDERELIHKIYGMTD